MSNESTLAENVILEVAEVIGTEEVSHYGLVGYDTTSTLIGCLDRPNSFDQAYNSINPADGFTPIPGVFGEKKVMYQGDSVGWGGPQFQLPFTAIGLLSYGCSQTTVNLACGGSTWDYEPYYGTKIIILLLGDSTGASWNGSPLSFWGSCNIAASAGSMYWLLPQLSNNLYNPIHNNRNYIAYNSQLAAFNVQGRCLYMQQQGTRKTYCWDVVDSHTDLAGANKRLMLMGNGKDQVSDIQNIFPDLYNNNCEDYDWYVSAYVHSGLWDSKNAEFTWDNQRESVPMSYYGERGQSYYYPNDCFKNTGYLGLRSAAFEHAYGAYLPEGYDCYELEIAVASLTNAKLHIFEGVPDDPNISTTNPPDITTTGVHKICLGALKRAAKWCGLGAGGTSAFKGRTHIPNMGAWYYFDTYAGSVTLLDAQAINSADPASVVIEYIKLTRKEPELQVTTTPVYGTTYFYTIDELAWNYLEVLESRGVPLSLSFSVGDLRDIGKRTSGYSKTFNIPASAHNNEILDPMLSVAVERQNISWMKARIQANGVYVFKGLMRVEEGNTGEGGYYSCHIIQDTIDWSQAIGDAKLCDVVIGEDPPLQKSYQNIVNSWSNTPPANNYFWGLVNYGEWYSAFLNGVGDYSKTSKDFHPVIFARSLIYKIFESIGYTLVSNFVDSPTFEQLCHPYCSGAEYIDSNLFGSGGSQFCHVARSTKTTAGGNFAGGGKIPGGGYDRTWYPDIVPGTDVGNNWSQNGSGGYNNGWTSRGDGYTVPFTGNYYMFASAKMYLSQNDLATQGGNMWIQINKNGSLWKTSFAVSAVMTSGASSGVTESCVDPGEFLTAGDEITFKFRANNNNNAFSCYYDASDMVLDIYPVPSAVVPDFEVNFQKVLPCDKQIDYIKGLTEMFNLQWTADEEKKTVFVEPYNDFFGSGKTVDWSNKLDYKTWGDKFIIEELAKNITFKYKKDTSDTAIKKEYEHREEVGQQIYQSHTETNLEKFRKEEVEMGTKYFHSTQQFMGFGTAANPSIWGGSYAWGDRSWEDDTLPNNPIMPVMWHGEVADYQWYSWGANSRPPYQEFPGAFKMRILNYYGKRTCNPWRFADASGNFNAHSEYPFIGWRDTWLDGVAEDPFCLSWGDHDENGFISPGLFTKYWKVAYEKMNGGAALRTCWMNLNPIDMATFDFRDLIHLKIDEVSTYWTVNKIIDYKPNQNVLTKVELIEWKQAADFPFTETTLTKLSDKGVEPPPAGSKGAFRRTKDDGLLLINHTENHVSGTGVSLGRGTVARNNQTVLGSYNQSNSRDILQIGSGIDASSRTTAFAITQDGEVEIQGGELSVEESDGIVHTLVYRETLEDTRADGVEKYQMKTLYLKKEDSEDDPTTGSGVSSY